MRIGASKSLASSLMCHLFLQVKTASCAKSDYLCKRDALMIGASVRVAATVNPCADALSDLHVIARTRNTW